MNETKAQTRLRFKKARLNLSNKERHAKSQEISRRLISFRDWSKITTLHIFEPIIALGEVDITEFINYIRECHSGVDMYTSRQVNNVWGTVPLDAGREVAAVNFEVIIVPMICFDSNLERIGYGGGFYDKFLSSQPNTQKIGVCFEVGKTTEVPVEPHDQSMDIIITEDNIYR